MRCFRTMCLLLSALLAGAASADDFSGPLVVVTRDTDAIGGPAEAHAKAWSERTGIEVRVLRLPFDQLYTRVITPILVGSESHDVLLVPSGWIGDLAPYLAPIPEGMRGALIPDDMLPAYRDIGRVANGDTVAIPIDGDMHIGAYRADLFADPNMRNEYLLATGRELAPPDTWEEYLRIADFFRGRVEPDGRRLRGTVEAFHPAGQRIWTFISHAAAYALHPDAPGSLFFDPDTMAPMIDSPAWVRALKDYKAARADSGLEADNIQSADVRALFVAGEAAMAIDWTDIGPLAVGPSSVLRPDQVGFFSLPGSREVWNPTRGVWDRRDDVWKVPHLAFGGWVAAVPATSPHRLEAWNYIAWLANPVNSGGDILDGSSGINPYRRSHLDDIDRWLTIFPRSLADSYLSVIRDALAAPRIAQDLRLPGAAAYLDALDVQVGRTLRSEIQPEEALHAAAAEWDFLTDRLGRGAQRRHYRSAMGVTE